MDKYQHLIISRLAVFIFHLLPVLFSLLLPACGKNRNPGLSDKELFAQQSTTDTLKQALADFYPETYIVPQGIKYEESRAVDPANPPVVIDIANRNLNIKKFDLSDYYTRVRYIKLKHPMSAAEGNFLFGAYVEGQGMMNSNFNSQFIFTNDYIVAGDILFGLHCYDKEGNFLYTLESNDYPKVYNRENYRLSYNGDDFKGFTGIISTVNNYCLYQVKEDNRNMLCLYDLSQKKRIITRPYEGRSAYLLDNNSMASYVYRPLDSLQNFLFTFDIKGDTLCRFQSYLPVPVITRSYYLSPPSSFIYYYNNQLTVRHPLNDTIYRVTSPNRLTPAYVLNFGSYGVDLEKALTDEQPEKMRPSLWKETERFILFNYTQNRNTPNNMERGVVKIFYSYYDKKRRQLYHITDGTTILELGYFIGDPVPDALPFILTQAIPDKDQLNVCYSKKSLEFFFKNKAFASLSSEKQNKLKTLQNDLDDSEVLIMILE